MKPLYNVYHWHLNAMKLTTKYMYTTIIKVSYSNPKHVNYVYIYLYVQHFLLIAVIFAF